MWFLPKCENVCIQYNPKYVDHLGSKKEWNEQLRKAQKEMIRNIALRNKLLRCGISI